MGAVHQSVVESKERGEELWLVIPEQIASVAVARK
jgi:hypothetical protein